MALAYGGHAFGAALNTTAERDAFQPNVGENLVTADGQSKARYGITLEQSQTALHDLLTVPGLGVVVQGLNSKLPTASPLGPGLPGWSLRLRHPARER